MSRRGQGAVWGYAATLAVATGVLLTFALDQPMPNSGLQSAPIWIIAVAAFLAQSLPVHLVTDRGRHTVSLVEPMLVIGMFTHSPTALIIGGLAGTIPAFIRLRQEPVKFAVNVTHNGFWIAAPAVLFDVLAGPLQNQIPTRAIGVAAGLALLAFLGSATTIRIPIGLATGRWWFAPGEIQQLVVPTTTAMGAASIALVAVALTTTSPGLLALLIVPIVQVVMSHQRQARDADARRALEFALDTSAALRTTIDPPRTLEEYLPSMVAAFDADEAYLVVTAPGRLVRLLATVDGCAKIDDVPGERSLRRIFAAHAEAGPLTGRSLADLEPPEELAGQETLYVPIPSATGVSGIVLVGRRLGPFRREHVELSRSFALAAGAAMDRQNLSERLDDADRIKVELTRRATRDALTGLANREAFEDQGHQAVVDGRNIAVLFIDLNLFKEINDEHGHAAGDAVLVATAKRLLNVVRSGELVARVGGDEFTILLLDADLEQAREIAQRIEASFDAPVRSVPAVKAISAAIGIAVSQPGDDFDDVLERADRSMYQDKRERSQTHRP